jgi:hypothetical protein
MHGGSEKSKDQKRALKPPAEGGWFWLPNNLVDHFGKSLGPIGLAVYVCLVRHFNQDKGAAWPSYERIAELLGMCRRTAIRGIQTLELAGLIQVDKSAGRHANRYKLTAANGDSDAPLDSPTVTQMHPNSDSQSPLTVTQMHPNSDSDALEQDLENKTKGKRPREEETPPSPPKGGGAGGEPFLLQFLATYPKERIPDNPTTLRRIWKRARLEAIGADILAGLERWKQSDQWAKDGGRYIPDPENFLDKRRWAQKPRTHTKPANSFAYDPKDAAKWYGKEIS